MKKILVVTHGDKESGKNPAQTEKGNKEIAVLRNLLPENPSTIVCGTGRRHLDVAAALGIAPTRYTCLAGDSDSLEVIDGKKFAVLADGTMFPLEMYSSLADNTPSAQAMVVGLPDQAVVCGGRPAMIMLGFPQAKSGGVYRISVEGDKIVAIDEVKAQGTEDPALKK